MASRSILRNPPSFALCLVGVTVLLLACGSAAAGSGGSGGPQPTPIPTATPTATPRPVAFPPSQYVAPPRVKPPTLAFNSSGSGDISFNASASGGALELHVQLEGGPRPNSGLDCEDWTVLKEPTAHYDAGALAAISAYFTDPVQGKSRPALPSTLQEVSGGAECFGALLITNTGSSPVQISQVGLSWLGDTAPNTFQYNLVDLCTFPEYVAAIGGAPECPGDKGHESVCPYMADFHLAGGIRGTHRDTPVTTDHPSSCPPLVVQPGGDPAIIELTMESTQPSLYSLSLTLTVTVGGVTEIVDLPESLDSMLVFAAHSQFACYGLQSDGATFAAEQHTVVDDADQWQTLNPAPFAKAVCL